MRFGRLISTALHDQTLVHAALQENLTRRPIGFSIFSKSHSLNAPTCLSLEQYGTMQ